MFSSFLHMLKFKKLFFFNSTTARNTPPPRQNKSIANNCDFLV